MAQAVQQRSCGKSGPVALLAFAVLVLPINPLAAQVNDSRDDGGEAFYDAILGTPNPYTPQPQDNVFATAYGLEQQAPRSQFTFNGLLPLLVNSNPLALSSGERPRGSSVRSPASPGRHRLEIFR